MPTALALNVGGNAMPSETVKPEDVPKDLQLLNLPEWFVNGSQVLWAGNDPILMFNKIIPSMPPPMQPGQAVTGLAYVAPIGLVRMSSEALKELGEAIRIAVELREKDIGRPIETDAMRQTAAQQKK
jgi:hypothetical protein